MSTPRKIRCVVSRVEDHGDHVYTVELLPAIRLPSFRSGQFLHLALDDYDPSGFWPESRVFSIASPSHERDCLRIIYSVKGVYTARMERELSEGVHVWVKLPYGQFIVGEGTDAVLIAGGTGITAFLAFIEGLPVDYPHKVVLLYGARRPGLLVGVKTVEAKRLVAKNFDVAYFVETQEPDGGKQGVGRKTWGSPLGDPGVSFHVGRLDLGVLKRDVAADATTYYLAGPPAMIAAFCGELSNRGVPGERICVDAWD